ncbi:TPA: YwhD family protein, partial [Staphylococcus aureus]|nr:YwhD family protein [Staphylococcus aureus]
SMPEHVNMMDKSMKHHIIIDQIGDENKAILKDFLMNHDEGMWKLSSDALHQAFN